MVRTLDDLGVAYMVTGSFASSIQGEPRLTHDIDLVVALRPADADRLIPMFPDTEFYFSPQAVRDAISRRRMFNLLEEARGNVAHGIPGAGWRLGLDEVAPSGLRAGRAGDRSASAGS